MNDLSGYSIGRYHILERLGQGGMATVYKAFDTHLERDVAIKMIRGDAFPVDAHTRILIRFEREAKALAKMSHANIVKVLDYGDYEGAPYLVMEFLPGGTLKQHLGHPMPYREAAKLLTPIARALAYAHGHNILHRDVKPSNILITESGEPVLTDFGIAKLLEEGEGETLTGTGMGLGTPEYMAPEQWMGKAVPASDQYSLCVVFYELVTGHKPFTADTPAAILLKQSNDPLPRPRDYVPDLPDEVERVIFKALAKKPEDRYDSMVEFENALEKLAFEETKAVHAVVKPSEIGEQDRTLSESSVPPPAPPCAIPAEPRRWWRYGLWGAGIVVLIGLSFLIRGWVKPNPALPAATQTSSMAAEMPAKATNTSQSPTQTSGAAVGVPPGQKFTVCEVTDTNGIDDNSYNAAVWKGILDAGFQFGIIAKSLETVNEEDYTVKINRFVEQKCDLIITAGWTMSGATRSAAEAHPDIKFSIVDVSYDPVIKNILSQDFQTDEAAFLAGYLAAGMTKTGKVGTFGGTDMPAVNAFMDGFARGVQHYNQKHDAKVAVIGWDLADASKGLYCNSYDDQEAGKRQAIILMNQGVDIMMPAAGSAGYGAAASAKARGNALIIGVDSDWYLTAPAYRSVILTSVMKNSSATTVEVIQSALDGSFRGGTLVGNLSNNGVALAPYHQLESSVPDAIIKELDEIRNDLVNGKIQLNEVYQLK